MSAKLITVFGATGSQGGSVVKALLDLDKLFNVRAVTRNPSSEASNKLKAKGVEVVQASMDDPDTLQSAVTGAYGVFLVTNFWEYMSKEREVRQGKNVADACMKAGVKHVVYSGLEKVKDITGWECPHFDGKGEVEDYLDEISLPNTSVRLPYYYENTYSFTDYQKQDDGSYTVTTCMKGPMDSLSVQDTGVVVASILKESEKYIGKRIGLSGDRLTMREYMDIVAGVTGKKIQLNEISPEEFAKFPFPGAADLAAMFHFYVNGNPVRDQQLTKELNPKTQSFKEWAEQNKSKFSINA